MSKAAKPPRRTLAEIAKSLGATLVGDGAFAVDSVAHPAAAEAESVLALAMDAGSLAALSGTKARAVVVAADADADIGDFAGGLVVERPRYALAVLLDLFAPPIQAYAQATSTPCLPLKSGDVSRKFALFRVASRNCLNSTSIEVSVT